MSALLVCSPYPWRWDAETGCIVDANGKTVCEFHSSSESPARPANARILAAAPALLANLKMMTDLAERYGVGEHCDGNIIEARELIASIEGGAT